MPRATVAQDTVRKELKTCPGGFVEIRQLPFGRMLARRDRLMRQTQEISPDRKPGDTARIQIETLQEASRQYDFRHCIVDHNLEDENGRKLDFSNPMSLDVLDPKIGTEIETYIDELNTDDDFDEKGFTQPSDSHSNNGMKEFSPVSDSTE